MKLLEWLLLVPLIPYAVVLLLLCRSLKTVIRPGKRSGLNTPVSVIISCRNEEERIPVLISDLSQQDYDPGLFEVIIVDDNSDDNTGKVASDFPGIRLMKVFQNKGRGKKSAVRTGVNASTGKLILTTDADCRLKKGWISSVVSAFELSGADMVISPVVIEKGKCLGSWFQELEFLSLQGITAATAINAVPVMCNGANLAFTRRAFLENSGNLKDNLVSGDDMFLLHGIKGDNGKVTWNGDYDAIVATGGKKTFAGFLRQRARWLSKSGSYSDTFTIILSLLALLANISIASLLAGSIFLPSLFLFFLAAFLVKSVPDFIILERMTRAYKRKDLLWWFAPSQVIYPFYVIAVSFFCLARGNRW